MNPSGILRTRREGRRSGFPAALARAVLLLFAVPALAAAAGDGVPRVSMSAGGVLVPGQSVAVAWDALPPDVEEFELLLRCELPRPLTIRLTESENPSVRGFTWRVPGVACTGARLVVRVGEAGRESEWAVGPSFEIRPNRERPVQRLSFVRGEFWISDRPVVAAVMGGADALRRAAPRGEIPGEAVLSRASVRPPESGGPRDLLPEGPMAGPGRPGGAAGRAPLHLPLRI